MSNDETVSNDEVREEVADSRPVDPPRSRMILLIVLTLVGALSGAAVSLSVMVALDELHSDKKLLHAEIATALANGADLAAVRQLFDNRVQEKPLRFKLMGVSDLYKEPVSLSTVLANIRASAFLRDEVDQPLVDALTATLALHRQTDPFDKLQPGQRVHFEHIQSTLGGGYEDIHPSVERIVNELVEQNALVTDYLRDATLSFRISVAALLVGLLALSPHIRPLASRIWSRSDRSGSAAIRRPVVKASRFRAAGPNHRRLS